MKIEYKTFKELERDAQLEGAWFSRRWNSQENNYLVTFYRKDDYYIEYLTGKDGVYRCNEEIACWERNKKPSAYRYEDAIIRNLLIAEYKTLFICNKINPYELIEL